METTESKMCQICNGNASKYKCPQCLLKYCSVSCYKKHKEQPCSNSTKPSDGSQKPELHINRSHQDHIGLEESEDKVPEELLKSLETSPDILSCLENSHLRTMMTNLVESEDQSHDMEKAMKEPIFTEFADKCLNVVDKKFSLKVPEG